MFQSFCSYWGGIFNPVLIEAIVFSILQKVNRSDSIINLIWYFHSFLYVFDRFFQSYYN